MYELKSRVRYSEVDENERLSLFAMINYFQDCCTQQSEDLGYGVRYLKDRGLAWYLVSWQIEIGRAPVLGERIRVTTELNMEGFYGARNFDILTEDGTRLVHAHSIWIFMNTVKGIPVRIPEEMENYGYNMSLHSNKDNRRIPLPEGMTEAEPVLISRSFLDTNHHMNNGQYVRIAEQLLPEGSTILSFRAEYKKEVLQGAHLYPRYIKDGDLFTVALADEAGKPYASVEFRLKEG